MFSFSRFALIGPLCAALFVPIQDAQARTFYVAPGGRDDTEATFSAPLGAPERAARFAAAGDTIVLRGGVYDLKSWIYIDKAGVSLVAYKNEKPILRAPTAESSKVPHVVVIDAPRVRIEGIEIRGGSYYGVKIDVDDAKRPASGVVIRGCRIGGTGRDCIKTFNADGLLIEGCNIGPSGVTNGSNAEGIDSIGSRGVTVRHCFVHDIATNGIYFKGGTTDGLIEGCKIQNSRSASGILLGQDTDAEFMRDGTPFEARRCTARNNTVVGTAGSGVGTYSGDQIRFENNTLIDVARETGAGVWVGVNRRSVGARGVSFRGNRVQVSGARPFAYLLNMAGSFAAQNNQYFAANGRGYFRTERAGNVKTLDFAQWRAATGSDGDSGLFNWLGTRKMKK